MLIVPKTSTISVIIPTLNEAVNLLTILAAMKRVSGVEVIVADGGSSDGTGELAKAAGVKVVSAPPGRAHQQNAGAAIAKGEILLFLHADTTLPEGFAEAIRAALWPSPASRLGPSAWVSPEKVGGCDWSSGWPTGAAAGWGCLMVTRPSGCGARSLLTWVAFPNSKSWRISRWFDAYGNGAKLRCWRCRCRPRPGAGKDWG